MSQTCVFCFVVFFFVDYALLFWFVIALSAKWDTTDFSCLNFSFDLITKWGFVKLLSFLFFFAAFIQSDGIIEMLRFDEGDLLQVCSLRKSSELAMFHLFDSCFLNSWVSGVLKISKH